MSKKQIKEELRKQLLEKKGETHEYGCVMLHFNTPKKSWDELQALIDDEDVYNVDGDKSYGREDEPHVTLLYGTLPSVTDNEIKEILYSEPTPKVSIKNISLFENDKFDVLKFDANGKILNNLNKKLSEIPNENSFPDYIPHLTICYLKSGKGEKVIKILKNLFDLKEFNEKLKISEYIYSKVDGSKIKYKLKSN
tara:strand:+ start:343 stop:927 length:585 start_codon:yes stop_codon:yes gene_type:complete